MRLHEAVESGRPFRLNFWDHDMWCHAVVGTDDEEEVQFVDGKRFVPFAKDLASNDWEVQPVAVSITYEQFWGAVGAVLKAEPVRVFGSGFQPWMLQPYRTSPEELMRQLAERLGLGAAKK